MAVEQSKRYATIADKSAPTERSSRALTTACQDVSAETSSEDAPEIFTALIGQFMQINC